MKTPKLILSAAALLLCMGASAEQWIRISQLGYLPQATKVAVLMSDEKVDITSFQVVNTFTGEVVLSSDKVTPTEELQFMKSTYRLNFSELTREGTYHIKAGEAVSPDFPVNGTIFNGTANHPLLGDYCNQITDDREKYVRDLRSDIQSVYDKAQGNPFLYGIPDVQCPNDLTAAIITQCILYRQLTGDRTYEEMEGSLRDWLLGCNPWGTNFIEEQSKDSNACMTFLLSAYEKEGREQTGARVDRNVYVDGGINRFDPTSKKICFVFTAANMADGADPIINTLHKHGIKAGFFFTGQFFKLFPDVVKRLVDEGHYVGSHSFGHLLTTNWKDGSTRVSKERFTKDMLKSFDVLREFGIEKEDAPYFIPAYETYNSTVASWADELGLQIINYTPGTWSNGDYTYPGMNDGYISTKQILDNIEKVEKTDPNGLGGHFILVHFGTVPERTDKLYNKLDYIIRKYQKKGYEFVGIEEALGLKMR